MQFQTSVHWSTQLKVVNGSSNAAEPFCDSNQITDALCLSNMQPFHAFLFTPGEVEDEQLLSAPCAAMEGQKQGGNTNYASSSTASNHALRNSHSCECIGPLRVSSQSEHNLRNSAPPSRQQLCEHANIRVCFYLCLFLLLCKVRANRVCPLSPSGSHRLNNLSMLA